MKENKWQSEARKIIMEFASASRPSERIPLIEHLGDRGLDLAVLEEILEFAVLGAIKKGLQ